MVFGICIGPVDWIVVNLPGDSVVIGGKDEGMFRCRRVKKGDGRLPRCPFNGNHIVLLAGDGRQHHQGRHREVKKLFHKLDILIGWSNATSTAIFSGSFSKGCDNNDFVFVSGEMKLKAGFALRIWTRKLGASPCDFSQEIIVAMVAVIAKTTIKAAIERRIKFFIRLEHRFNVAS